MHPELNKYNERERSKHRKSFFYIFNNNNFPKEVSYINLAVLFYLPYMIVNEWGWMYYVLLIVSLILTICTNSDIPIQIMIIFFIIYANRISWLSKRWDGVDFFRKKQEYWNLMAFIIIIASLILRSEFISLVKSIRVIIMP